MFSACLLSEPCTVDGSSYEVSSILQKLKSLPNVKAVQFCPEDFAFGTPRAIPDIHGGNGFDVLAGKAKVLNDQNEDWTDELVAAGSKMVDLAKSENVDIAI